MDETRVARAGRLLAQARREGGLVACRDCDLRGIGSLAEAEDVQAEAAAMLGFDRIGHAIAGTTPEIALRLGCAEPIAGPLFPNDCRPSGSALRVTRSMLGVGAQLAFLFGRSYPQDGERLSLATVADAVAGCHVALQVLARRTEASVPLNDWVGTADFGFVECVVQGASVRGWRELDLGGCAVKLVVDGHTCASGRAGDTLGNPLAPLVWLARYLDGRGRSIEAGEIVAVGSCTRLLQLTPGRTVAGVFESLGSVEMRLV